VRQSPQGRRARKSARVGRVRQLPDLAGRRVACYCSVSGRDRARVHRSVSTGTDAMAKAHFTTGTFSFLRDLKKNNDRDWFGANRARYREHVQEPAVRFVSDFAPHLEKISGRFRADPRPVGGSIFRIHRDTRFSKDKSPYKTHLGIQFRHESAKSAHTPGFYLHIEPEMVFVGVGIWHPEAPLAKKIREHMIEKPDGWTKATGGKRFRDRLELGGDSLKRPPRGIDPEHPLIEDLKRKDFIASATLPQATVLEPGFIREFSTICSAGSPFVKYICEALALPF
jgi:uncharacterized protein (TIGR02453 family)